MGKRLHAEAKSPVRQQQSDRGTVFEQDFLILDRDSDDPSDPWRGADLNLYFWVEVLDPAAMSLLDGHCFLPSSRIALPSGESQLVTLRFDVPDQFAPGVYPYTIVVKCEQVLEETVRIPLELEILPAASEVRFKPIPGFIIDPSTTASKPLLLQPGETTTFKITVENRSNMSDRFYLTCPNLPKEWYTLKYLDYGDRSRDVVQAPNGLQLNGHERGEILLTLYPPNETLAGDYCFPLQLLSMNYPDLGMVDEIYLQLLPDAHLGIQLSPEIQYIGNHPKVFTLTLVNRGNVYRQFKLEVKDSAHLFAFAIDPPDQTLELAPKANTTVLVQAIPKQRWKRPWGNKPKRLLVSFNLISMDTSPLLATPISPQARLVWRPYPRWMRLMLFGLGTGAIALMFLFILYCFNRQPSPALQIAEFRPSTPPQSSDRRSVQVDWRVINPGTLAQVELSRVEAGAELENQRYNFSAGIPAKLAAKSSQGTGCRSTKKEPAGSQSTSSLSFWQLPLPPIPIFSALQQAPAAVTTIECRGISIATPQPGQHRFRLKLFSKQDPKIAITDQTTNPVMVPGTASAQSTPETSAIATSQSPSSRISTPIRPPEIALFTVNGKSVSGQPIQTYSLRNQNSVGVVIRWQVTGNNVTVQLLPSPGSVSTQGTLERWLKPGSSQTFTLVAKNELGEVSQSVVVQATRAQTPRSRPAPTVSVPSPSPLPEENVNQEPVEDNNQIPEGEPTPSDSGDINENSNASPTPASPELSPSP